MVIGLGLIEWASFSVRSRDGVGFMAQNLFLLRYPRSHYLIEIFLHYENCIIFIFWVGDFFPFGRTRFDSQDSVVARVFLP